MSLVGIIAWKTQSPTRSIKQIELVCVNRWRQIY